jgi:hypothetical protein
MRRLIVMGLMIHLIYLIQMIQLRLLQTFGVVPFRDSEFRIFAEQPAASGHKRGACAP